MQILSKSDLVAALAEKAGVNKATATSVLAALADVVSENVAAGNVLTIPGIAKVQVKATPERTVRNPSTGATTQKPAGRAVRLSVVKGLKDAVAG